jgi:hypothetical protein
LLKKQAMHRLLITCFLALCVVQVEAQCVWVGGTLGNLTKWNRASNWTGAGCGFGSSVPAIDDAVTIPTTIFDPVITTAANCASLDINPLADVTLTTNGYLTVDGQITISALGTFNMDDGDLAFKGVSNFIVDLGTWNVTGGKVHLSRSVDDTQIFNDNNVFDNVTIDGGRKVTMTTTIDNVKTMTISEGSTLDIVNETLTATGGGKLKIKNNSRLLLSGTSNFPTGFATYEFDAGSFVEYYLNGAQTLAEHDYWHLDLTGGGTKSITSGEIVGVQGVLDIEDGATLATLGYGAGEAYVRLMSTGEAANQTAKIADLSDESTGNITGDGVMCERYIDLTNPDKVYWNDWCSPLTNLYLKSWYYAGWPMTGVGGTDYANNPFCSVLQYDASTIGTEYGTANGLNKNDGWVSMSHINDVVTNGRGVRIYTGARNRIMQDLGTPRIGDLQVVLDYYDEPTTDQMQEGWNLIGNPYMCTIDFDNISFTKISDGTPASGGIDTASNDYINAFWVYSNNNGYYTYNGLSGIGTAPYYVNAGNFAGASDASLVSSHKAFWVKVNNTNVRIDFEEGDKNVLGTQFVKNSNNAIPKIRVEVEQLGSGLKNAAVVAFAENAEKEFESMDSEFLGSANASAPRLFFKSTDGKALAVNVVPLEAQEIPVTVKLGQLGYFTLTFYDLGVLPTGYCMWLEDKLTDQWTAISEDLVLSFNSSIAIVEDRFVIHIKGFVGVSEVADLACFGLENGAIALEKFGAVDTVWMNVYRNETWQSTVAVIQNTAISNLTAGNYTIIPVSNFGCSNALINAVVKEPAEIAPSFTWEKNNVMASMAVKFINTSVGASAAQWYFSDNASLVYGDTVYHTFAYSGTFEVTLLAGNEDFSCSEKFSDTIQVKSDVTDVAKLDNENVQVFYKDGLIHIRSTAEINEVVIRDVKGSEITSVVGFGKQNIQLPFSAPAGIYMVVCKLNDGIKNYKIIVE